MFTVVYPDILVEWPTRPMLVILDYVFLNELRLSLSW